MPTKKPLPQSDLRDLRKQAWLTQEQLGRAIGLSAAFIGDVERGKSLMSLSHWRLAKEVCERATLEAAKGTAKTFDELPDEAFAR